MDNVPRHRLFILIDKKIEKWKKEHVNKSVSFFPLEFP